MDYYKVKITILTIITMTTTWCVWPCDLNSLWFTLTSNLSYMEGKLGIKEWHLNWGHLFPRVLKYRVKGDIKVVDIRKFRIYYYGEVDFGLI